MAISYSAVGAAEATGVSETQIRDAVRDGELSARYSKSKLIVRHEDLWDWVNNLPTDKPEVGR